MTNTITGVLTVFVVIASIAIYREGELKDQYKAQCAATGGKPVYNGKHWECFK